LWRQRRWWIGIGALAVVSLLFVSSYYSVYRSFEGLSHISTVLATNYERQEKILQYTSADAVIVTRFGDKYIFPHRDVIPGLTLDVHYAAVQALLAHDIEVWWYDLSLDLDSAIELRNQLHTYGLQLTDPIDMWDNLELRRIEFE